MRIDSHPDIVDALKVTLTMTYFNAAPYTVDFSYQGDDGKATSAYASSKFRQYIAEWRAKNMDQTGSLHPAEPKYLARTRPLPAMLSISVRHL
jgi:hypothetical protein